MLHITLFGKTAATNDPEVSAPTNLGGSKPRQILEILALADGSPVAKDQLADLLWDGAPPRSYLGTVESYVCVLRRRLGCSRGRDSAITTTSNGYQLDMGQVRVDLSEVRSLLARASIAAPASAVRFTQAALGMVDKPLLSSEPYADWAVREREAFARQLVDACAAASAHAVTVHELGQAVSLARSAVEFDHLAEHAWQQLMRALWASGRRAEALRVYHDLRSAMLEELAIEPSKTTHALFLEILRDETEAALDTDQGPGELRTLLVLLRRTLESLPGVEPTLGDSGLSYVAVKVLSAV